MYPERSFSCPSYQFEKPSTPHSPHAECVHIEDKASVAEISHFTRVCFQNQRAPRCAAVTPRHELLLDFPAADPGRTQGGSRSGSKVGPRSGPGVGPRAGRRTDPVAEQGFAKRQTQGRPRWMTQGWTQNMFVSSSFVCKLRWRRTFETQGVEAPRPWVSLVNPSNTSGPVDLRNPQIHPQTPWIHSCAPHTTS